MSNLRLGFNLKRALLGSAASVAAVFVVITVPSLLGGLLTQSMNTIEKGIGLGFFAAAYSAAILAIWGLPSHFLFVVFRKNSVFNYLVSGLLGGPMFLLVFRPFGYDPIETLIKQVALLGFFGVLASFVFWYVGVRIEKTD